MTDEPAAPPPGLDPSAPPPSPPSDAERAADLERRLSELEASTTTRLIPSELKAVAVRAGMIDLDGLKLIDAADLKLDAEGNVKGAGEVMRELRRAKPWLFGGASTSSSASPPPAEPPRPKLATEMSYDEWQAARAELLKRA
jgi:hypothetical protein